jgi:predicted transcriptional regulator
MASDEATITAALLQATATIAASYISIHKIGLHEIDDIVNVVYQTLEQIQEDGEWTSGSEKALVDIAASITPEYLICLEDGKKLKMLKRYLKTNYNMTPEEYRKRWNLPADYPMVAPNYAKRRSELAKDIGLGKQSIRQRKQVAISKFKGGVLPAGKGKLRIVRSTDIMTTRTLGH